MMRKWFSLLLLTLLSPGVAAQYFSENNLFSVPDQRACAPYVPVVTSAFCTGPVACTFFPDENNQTFSRQLVSGDPIPDFAYTEPGTYRMRVVSGANANVVDHFTITIYADVAPDFNIYTCTGNRIQLDIADSGYEEYDIDYESDGISEAIRPAGLANPFFTYPNSTPKTVTVKANHTNCVSAMSKTVTPVPGAFLSAPQITELEVGNDNGIRLDLATSSNFLYQLDISTNSSSAWTKRSELTNETTTQVLNLNPDNAYYCFRLGAINICDGPAPTYAGANVICSADAELQIASDQINLSWNTSNTGVGSFTILRDPGNSATTAAVPPFAYTDTDIICGTTYSYQIVHEYGAGIRSYSKTLTGTAQSNRTPSAINNISSVVNGSTAELVWNQDPAFAANAYDVYRIANGASRMDETVNSTTYTDDTWTLENEICYQIRYKDVCGNQSDPGRVACPIVLEAGLQNNNNATLSWSDYNGWINGVDHYIVEKYDEAGQLIESIDVGRNTTFNDVNDPSDPTQVFIYRIVAIASDVTVSLPSISNEATIVKSPNLAHPSAFIPNSPIASNRTFRVFGNYINGYHLKVFNRWGELIFESFDPERGWDGMFRGQRMPEGTYVFQARVTDFAGRNFEYAGTVVLLKKD